VTVESVTDGIVVGIGGTEDGGGAGTGVDDVAGGGAGGGAVVDGGAGAGADEEERDWPAVC